jgi:hypothetical protein
LLPSLPMLLFGGVDLGLERLVWRLTLKPFLFTIFQLVMIINIRHSILYVNTKYENIC